MRFPWHLCPLYNIYAMFHTALRLYWPVMERVQVITIEFLLIADTVSSVTALKWLFLMQAHLELLLFLGRRFINVV